MLLCARYMFAAAIRYADIAATLLLRQICHYDITPELIRFVTTCRFLFFSPLPMLIAAAAASMHDYFDAFADAAAFRSMLAPLRAVAAILRYAAIDFAIVDFFFRFSRRRCRHFHDVILPHAIDVCCLFRHSFRRQVRQSGRCAAATLMFSPLPFMMLLPSRRYF